MKIAVDEKTGELKIDLADYLANLDKDKYEEVTSFLSVAAFEVMSDMVRNEYAAARFNDCIYKLRLAFFQSEDVPNALRQTIDAMMHDIASAEAEATRYREAYIKLWHAWPLNEWKSRPDMPDWEHIKSPTTQQVYDLLINRGIDPRNPLDIKPQPSAVTES